jgi:hypothetical protein
VTAWKDLERRVCAELGGRRAGPIGQAVSDCVNTPYSVEVKRTAKLQLRGEWLEQARRQSRDEGKPWILVIGSHGDRNPIVIQDFKTWAARERS